jgi:hypothetical protein
MIKHIEGTKAGDRVTRNTPVRSVVRVEGSEFADCNGSTMTIYVTAQIKLLTHYTKSIVVTPGPLPWHHRLWNWIAERCGK